jgi:hypothetical protein
MDEPKDGTRNVPLLPIFGSLTIFYTILLEVGIVIGIKLSAGKWPAPAKYGSGRSECCWKAAVRNGSHHPASVLLRRSLAAGF